MDILQYSFSWLIFSDVQILPGAQFGSGETCEVIETFTDNDHCEGYISGAKVWIEDNSSGPHIAG